MCIYSTSASVVDHNIIVTQILMSSSISNAACNVKDSSFHKQFLFMHRRSSGFHVKLRIPSPWWNLKQNLSDKKAYFPSFLGFSISVDVRVANFLLCKFDFLALSLANFRMPDSLCSVPPEEFCAMASAVAVFFCVGDQFSFLNEDH
jgi:hypothetical protein